VQAIQTDVFYTCLELTITSTFLSVTLRCGQDAQEIMITLKLHTVWYPFPTVLMSSLSRSLKALNCPFAADFSIASREHVVILVRWLEDRKIREYDIQERVCLQESPEWETHFNTYLERLGCPFKFSSGNPIDSIAWLISFAVSLDYDDCEFDTTKTACSSSSSTTSNVSTKLDDIGGLVGLPRNSEETDTGETRLFLQSPGLVLTHTALYCCCIFSFHST